VFYVADSISSLICFPNCDPTLPSVLVVRPHSCHPLDPRLSGFLHFPCNLTPNFRLHIPERLEMTSHDEKSKKAKTVKKKLVSLRNLPQKRNPQ
jgi:hypothetical protein